MRARSHPTRFAVVILFAGMAIVAAMVVAIRHGGGSNGGSSPAPTGGTPIADACIVRLHGKGGASAPSTVVNGVSVMSPSGNAAGWGGRQWLYFPEDDYQAARSVVADAVAAPTCARVVIDGFSNGAAFAAKLYCKGETFDGRVVGFLVDDPVTDHAVDGCAPAAGVKIALYWTGALEGQAVAGWSCASADWTCEGGSTVGIAAYAKALGTPAQPSPNHQHAAYLAAPEQWSWFTE